MRGIGTGRKRDPESRGLSELCASAAIPLNNDRFLKAHGKTDMVEKEMFVLGLIRQPNIIELVDHFESNDKVGEPFLG